MRMLRQGLRGGDSRVRDVVDARRIDSLGPLGRGRIGRFWLLRGPSLFQNLARRLMDKWRRHWKVRERARGRQQQLQSNVKQQQ